MRPNGFVPPKGTAPIETVWQFVMDPHQVAPCLPGAKLEEVVDERNFLGVVKIKIGAITAQYKGKVELTKIDEAGRVVVMSAEAQPIEAVIPKPAVEAVAPVVLNLQGSQSSATQSLWPVQLASAHSQCCEPHSLVLLHG